MLNNMLIENVMKRQRHTGRRVEAILDAAVGVELFMSHGSLRSSCSEIMNCWVLHSTTGGVSSRTMTSAFAGAFLMGVLGCERGCSENRRFRNVSGDGRPSELASDNSLMGDRVPCWFDSIHKCLFEGLKNSTGTLAKTKDQRDAQSSNCHRDISRLKCRVFFLHRSYPHANHWEMVK
jgi:hypothetical protein